MGGFVWVTLATNDSYSLGALVLANSLRQVNTEHQLAVLITPAVSPAMRKQLESIFNVVKIVDVLDSKDEANLALLKRPELGITFTKLHCWQLTQFEKGVFLDADTLVVRNCDELFEREEFSAAPDVGWPDCFNSGVFVFRPALETFNNLVQFAVEKGSFDGGDQGLLNQFFNNWATDDIRKHLPFVYNLTSVAVYSYIPAFKQYGADTRIVHFIGPVKPWLQPVDSSTRTVTPTADSTHLQQLLQKWWDIFIDKVHPGLSTDLEFASGMLPFFAQLTCSQESLDCTSVARSDPIPEPVAPQFPDPYTDYIEKNDERQYNLPYQPFQVVSNQGELLNITFADFVRENEPDVIEEIFYPPPDETPVVPQEKEEHVEEERKHEEENKEHQDVVLNDCQFDYHQFVPDETCISAYLEHNVQEYQPYDLNEPDNVHVEPLPRFLTIPEDDSRQSQKPYVPEVYHNQNYQHWEEPRHVHDFGNIRPISPVPEIQEEPIITKSKSMSNLVFDATDSTYFGNLTTWKSQPDVNPDVKKLPGLKPLIPKERTPIKSLNSPKFTEFTEVYMNLENVDPFAPPVDNIGFVERAIMNKKQLFHDDYVPIVPKTVYPVFQTIPEMNEYVDLENCQRQAGNVVDVLPVSSGGLKTFTPKISPRRVKRTTRRSAEKWKPPETNSSMYDVDDILKRLSEFSIGYTPPKEPEIEILNLETPADRLFSGSKIDEEPIKKKKKQNFGPIDHSSPFAAPFGQSLSELEKSVPEIVVNVASPEKTSRINETDDEPFLTPKATVNGTSSDESFLSALSSPPNKTDEIVNGIEKISINEENGISDVKDWEKILDKNLTEMQTYAGVLKQSPGSEFKNQETIPTLKAKEVKKTPKSGGKRPRKPKKVEEKTEEKEIVESPPLKYNKRKIEKPVVELPANRFELLPKETQKLTNPKKKIKKIGKKFSVPSSSLPFSNTNKVNGVQEETTPYLPEPDDNPGIAGAIAQLNLEPSTKTPSETNSAAQAEYLRRQSWETGQMDYMGRDSFANVWSKISETLSTSPIPEINNQPSPTFESRPNTLPINLDSDSIDTLPNDATLSPGETADDDVIFDRSLDTDEPSSTLPGILEEPEEEIFAKMDESAEKEISPNVAEKEISPEIVEEPPTTPIGSDSSAFAAYKPANEPKTIEPPTLRRQSSSDEKRGVFTKILEFVGVVKKREEVETSVFYDEPSPAQEIDKSVEGIEEILKATDLATIADEAKKRSPSPRITIPETVVITATPPMSPDQKPPRRDPEALTIDNPIPETPPVPPNVEEKKTQIFVESDRNRLMTDIDKIIDKAILIAEDQLDIVPEVVVKPPIAVLEEFEEIKVTSDEERKRPVDKPTSSKLAQQILKAIPPPRRKQISDAKNQPGPSVSIQVDEPLDIVVAQQPPPVPPRRRNRSKQRTEH